MLTSNIIDTAAGVLTTRCRQSSDNSDRPRHVAIDVESSCSLHPEPLCRCADAEYYVNQSPITESDIDFPYASTSLDKDTGV